MPRSQLHRLMDSNNVFDFMHRGCNQQRFPLAFFTQEYGATMYGFAESIGYRDVHLISALVICQAGSTMGQFWRGAPVKETKSEGDNGGSATISDEVAPELKKVQSLARSMQSQHDRIRTIWIGYS